MDNVSSVIFESKVSWYVMPTGAFTHFRKGTFGFKDNRLFLIDKSGEVIFDQPREALNLRPLSDRLCIDYLGETYVMNIPTFNKASEFLRWDEACYKATNQHLFEEADLKSMQRFLINMKVAIIGFPLLILGAIAYIYWLT